MKKRFLSIITAAIFLSLSFNVNTTYAATCPPHSNYQDVVQYQSYSTSTHKVYYNHWVGGEQSYSYCKVITESRTHFIKCGVCGTQVGYYPETNYSHSIAHN